MKPRLLSQSRLRLTEQMTGETNKDETHGKNKLQTKDIL
jgi:hypothetical protein